jgi:formylglycine-generating enzyme required for sulfatase activity/ribosomal protein L40E
VKVGGLGPKPLAGPRHARQREAFELVCPKCGNELPEKAKFCHECGHSVSGESGAEAPDVSLGGLATLAGGTGAPVPSPVDASLGGLRTVSGPGDGSTSAPGDGIPLSDRYEVKEEIGRGGFAVVHLGRDLRLDRPVAIKRLLPEAVAGPHGERTVERFEREAQAIASLNHRNVVAVYDTDRDADGRYIVMEYVEGGTLRDHLKESGPLPVSEAVTLVVGICRGLASAHRKGVVHRDVKPANILLARDGDDLVPKLTDFGLARSGGGSDVSMTGFGMGTPFYMAPEQRRDAKGVNHTADIFSVGKTLYELVTGQVPENVDPGEIPPPPELAEIIFRCIRTKPEERYFSVEDLVRDLEALPDPDAPVPARQSSTGGANPCPQCGAENPVSSLFCVSCGSGMSRDCPECGAKNSVNLTFCGQCGTGVEEFATIAEALARMAEHRGKKRWSRVTKELEALPPEPRLPGEKGTKLLEEARRLGREAEDALAQLRELAEAIGTSVEAQTFDEALELLDRHAEQAPEDEKMPALREQVLDARNLASLGEQVGALGRALEAGKLAEARQAAERAEGIAAGRSVSPEQSVHEGWEELRERLAESARDLTAREEKVAELRDSAGRLLAENSFEAALAVLAEAKETYPECPECCRLAEEAEKQVAREGTDHFRMEVYLSKLVAHLKARELVEAREVMDEGAELLASRSVSPEESVHGDWENCRERLAELGETLGARESRAAMLVASCREHLSSGALVKAGALVGEIDAIHACRAEDEGLPEALREARRARFRRRAKLACALLAVLIVSGLLLGREIRFRLRVSAFRDAVAAERMDKALRLAELVKGRHSPAGEFIDSHWQSVHEGRLAMGAEALTLRNWAEAEQQFGLALAVPGYGDDQDAITGRQDAQLGTALASARAAKERKDWQAVDAATDRALALDGGNREASSLKREGQVEVVASVLRKRLARAEQAKARPDWPGASTTLSEARPREPFAGAFGEEPLRSLLTRLVALKREAAGHLAPSLRVVCVLDGREVAGAAITVNGTLQKATTPATLNLAEGKTYAFQVTLPERGPRSTAFAKSLTAGWKGERELRAVVEEMTDPTAGNVLGMAFVEVPAGSFRMVSNDGGDDEKPMHEVRITKPFWIGKHEVTQTEYEKFMGKNPSRFKGARNPVEQVSWDDVTAFCKKLTERVRAAGRLPVGYEYRLPSEAEWEYAARGGTNSKGFTYSGSNDLKEVGWYGDNSGRKPHPVGQKKPNELGLHDMSGNVWEWCLDWYGGYPSGAVIDPTGARTGQYRVRRGGGWDGDVGPCRSAFRGRFSPSYRSVILGFRVVLGPAR